MIDENWLAKNIHREQVGTVPIFFYSREQIRQVENIDLTFHAKNKYHFNFMETELIKFVVLSQNYTDLSIMQDLKNEHRRYIQSLETFHGYIFRILQRFATKLSHLTNFKMLVLDVLFILYPRSIFSLTCI